jgi:hypothetical protein
MAKWEKRMQAILDGEKKKHTAVYKLTKEIQEAVHGLDTIGIKYVRPIVQRVVNNTHLIDSTVKSILIEPYNGRNPDENQIVISLDIEGDFNGFISVETGSGYRNTDNGRIPIYYVSPYDTQVVSNKKEQVVKMYKAHQMYAITDMVDIALKSDTHLRYEDKYKNYEIWHKEPSEYGDSIKGDLKLYDEEKRYKQYKEMSSNTSLLVKCENVRDFAEEKLHGKGESITYEWTEYII